MTAAARRATAERQKAYRCRQAAGERIYAVKASDKVLLALMRRGLTEADSRKRKVVAGELAAVLEQWAAHWIK